MPITTLLTKVVQSYPIRLLIPEQTESSIWEKTGRLEKMEGELLRAVDRSGRGFVFSPTHEEAVTSLVAGLQPVSHKYYCFTFN